MLVSLVVEPIGDGIGSVRAIAGRSSSLAVTVLSRRTGTRRASARWRHGRCRLPVGGRSTSSTCRLDLVENALDRLYARGLGEVGVEAGLLRLGHGCRSRVAG